MVDGFVAGRPPTSDEPSTRLRILEAALRAFAADGYQGTSIRDISARCGTRQPTIYHYFQSKENLFRVVLRGTRLTVMRQLRRRIDRGGDLKQELLSCFRAIQEYYEQDPAPIRFIFRLVYSTPAEIEARYPVRHAGDFQGLIQSAFRRHGALDHGTEKAQVVTHLLQAMLLRMSTPGSEPPSLGEYERMLDLVLG